jgi:hypothetical protein
MATKTNLVPWNSRTIKQGQKYGRLTIISTHKASGTYKYYAFCDCDCGTKNFITRVDNLRDGRVLGCGCVHREAVTTHGRWGHPMLIVWSHMINRCYNPKDGRYSHYGARGISVCEKWKDIEQFIADMFGSYEKGLTIERINNNGNYCPENCRWATRTEQARNKSSNVNISFDGKTLCLSEWSQLIGVPYGTLWERIKILGWPPERALTTPSK